MLRGNHESREMAQVFNFKQEVLYKFDQEVYSLITEWFDCLPLAAVVNKKFFAVHGGLSPDLEEVSQIDKLSRFTEIPKKGVCCDLVWSDPIAPEKSKQVKDFDFNNERKCSWVYGPHAIKNFLKKNGLLSIIRAHEVQFEGYKMHNYDSKGFPQVITIFSAPNYCQMYKNKAAIIRLK